jgi:hypothetical protein
MSAGLDYKYRLQNLRVVAAAFLYVLFFILLYPQYQYILDDDGVAYATITRRWAAGDYFSAINGLWSPLHCWIAIPFYKAGLSLTDAFRYSNGAIAIGILLSACSWLKALPITKHLQTIALLVMLPFLLYLTFFQLAADNLFCLLFLMYLKFCSLPDAFTSNKKIIIAGFFGCLLYLAKAYGFPFFVLHFTLWQVWLYSKSKEANKKALLFQNLLLGIGVFVAGCLPWIAALHYKYGLWTISLNVNYGLIPNHPVSDLIFIAPPWPDSPTLWEDPFIRSTIVRTQVPLSQFYEQLPKAFLHNTVQLIQSLNRFSFAGVSVLVALGVYALGTKDRLMELCTASMLLLPSGYLILHVEDRFLWPIFFLLLICGTKMLQQLMNNNTGLNQSLRVVCWAIFFASFLLTPVDNLQNMLGRDKAAFQLARYLRQQKLTGKVASNGDYSFMRQVAFYAGNQYFESTPQHILSTQLPQQLTPLNLRYYYLFYPDDAYLKTLANTPLLKGAKRTWKLKSYNLLVLEL